MNHSATDDTWIPQVGKDKALAGSAIMAYAGPQAAKPRVVIPTPSATVEAHGPSCESSVFDARKRWDSLVP